MTEPPQGHSWSFGGIVPGHEARPRGRSGIAPDLRASTARRGSADTSGGLTRTMSKPKKRIGILVVAYNAATTLAKTLDRVPDDFRPRHRGGRSSATTRARTRPTWSGSATSRSSDLPITVIRQPENLGYGGNQKAGYHLAIEHGLDIVVLLHGDGQYAPESLPELLGPC